ncbi:hypothetical protein BDV26DRAFT_268851 [Aspergillus bertholletiae]|uniref:Uncharacterized protein n=1 Tax=Aspergillus bertholletiae TaxID=1226010 RepID=A0A5N7AYN0_9EURO|nr:hypothetical protein BDV26DRAFT_268851 [Aspergillus bertholletiae]
MTKKNGGSNNSLPGSSSTPSISRSTIAGCTFNGLTAADSIHRSKLDSVTVFRKPSLENSTITPISPGNTAIHRSKLRHTVITNSYLNRCKLTNCELADVCSAKSLDANDSRFDHVDSIRRTSVQTSTVMGQSTLNRCKVTRSFVTDKSHLRRDQLEDVRIARSQVERSELRNCHVSDCVIIRTDFTGMSLRFGVWKNGKLVGRVGDNEVIMITEDGQVSNTISI